MRQREKKLQQELARKEVGRNNYAAWSRLSSSLLSLPAYISIWTAAGRNYTNPQLFDIGGGGYDLTNNNTAQFGSDGLVPIVRLVSGSSQCFSRADGGALNWADVLGTETTVIAADRGLTVGGIFKLNDAIAAFEWLFSKDTGAGATRSYALRRSNVGAINAVAWDSVGTLAQDTGGTLSSSVYHVAALCFDPGATIGTYLDGTLSTTATAITNIRDSTAPFTIGATGTPSSYSGMDLVAGFLCAANVASSTLDALYQQVRALLGV